MTRFWTVATTVLVTACAGTHVTAGVGGDAPADTTDKPSCKTQYDACRAKYGMVADGKKLCSCMTQSSCSDQTKELACDGALCESKCAEECTDWDSKAKDGYCKYLVESYRTCREDCYVSIQICPWLFNSTFLKDPVGKSFTPEKVRTIRATACSKVIADYHACPEAAAKCLADPTCAAKSGSIDCSLGGDRVRQCQACGFLQ